MMMIIGVLKLWVTFSMTLCFAKIPKYLSVSATALLEKLQISRCFLKAQSNEESFINPCCCILGFGVGVLKISENLSDYNIWRRKSQTWPYKNCGTFIFSKRHHMFANRAAKEIQQPHTANRPNLAALQLSRAEP